MSEGARRKLELRLAAARRLASPLLDDLTKERIEALIRDLEQKLAAVAPGPEPESDVPSIVPNEPDDGKPPK